MLESGLTAEPEPNVAILAKEKMILNIPVKQPAGGFRYVTSAVELAGRTHCKQCGAKIADADMTQNPVTQCGICGKLKPVNV